MQIHLLINSYLLVSGSNYRHASIEPVTESNSPVLPMRNDDFPARNRVYRYRPEDLIAQEQAILRFIRGGIFRSSVIPLQTGNPRRFSRCNGEISWTSENIFEFTFVCSCLCLTVCCISCKDESVKSKSMHTKNKGEKKKKEKKNDGLLISLREIFEAQY